MVFYSDNYLTKEAKKIKKAGVFKENTRGETAADLWRKKINRKKLDDDTIRNSAVSVI